MNELRSGAAEGIPYSLSRWTDVPASKWGWFRECLSYQQMMAFDPLRTAPSWWSLAPEDTLGLVFWTKDPTNLIRDRQLLAPYKTTVHVTITGWEEVEKGAPTLHEAGNLLVETARAFETVYWRFSPIPLLPGVEVLNRFNQLLFYAVVAGLDRVYVSFLQENDLLPETRTDQERTLLLQSMEEEASRFGVSVLLCADDTSLSGVPRGVCVPPSDFAVVGPVEGCGCPVMADPFTINEVCSFGCQYCLDPSTPILRSNLVWDELRNIKVGDELFGFDEYAPGSRLHRRFQKAEVLGVYHRAVPCIKITTETGVEIIASEDHKWMTVADNPTRKGWTETRKLSLRHRLLHIVSPHADKFDDDYRRGYFVGISRGDGTCRFEGDQVYWRLALVDEEALIRTKDFLLDFGVEVHIRPFDGGSKLSKQKAQKVETRARVNLDIIYDLLHNEYPDTDSFKKGFLAGIFDSEGSYNANLRVHQTQENGILDLVEEYANYLGLPTTREESSVRFSGELRNRIKFFVMTNPAITRKVHYIYGQSINVGHERIVSLERVGMRDVIDIETTTGTFVAAGFATHNCYAADKSLSNKKRNTTRGSLKVLR